MKRLIVYPYKMGSGSASRICEGARARGLRALKVYPDRKFRYREEDLILNWGNSTLPKWFFYSDWPAVLNHPDWVAVAANKLHALRALVNHRVPTLVYTTDYNEVLTDLDQYGTKYEVQWMARTKLTGHSGDGIVPIYSGLEYGPEGDVFPIAPLYTKYFKRKAEYRVHVFNGEVIDWQQKMKRRDHEEIDTVVRCHNTGWIYARDSATEPDQRVLDASIAAVSALGLDFGAVDVAWNQRNKQAAVFEVNTAPGLTGTTLIRYVDKLQELLQ